MVGVRFLGWFQSYKGSQDKEPLVEVSINGTRHKLSYQELCDLQHHSRNVILQIRREKEQTSVKSFAGNYEKRRETF
jgi:hypothetical protein